MSWPTDGESRFVVREHSGYLGLATAVRVGLSVYVMDRAYAHRVIRTWRTEDGGGTQAMREARCRGAAVALADQLNAQHEAAAG